MKVMKFLSPLLYVTICIIWFSVSSCKESGSKTESGIAQDQGVEKSTGLTGRLTFDQYMAYRELSSGLVEVYLPSAQLKRLSNGVYGWRHPDGDIVMAKGCGNRVNRLVVFDDKTGRETIASPCSNEIPNSGASPSMFEFSRLSPDKGLIAAEVRYYLNGGVRYATVIIKNKEIIKAFDNFGAPEWLPDGRLVLVSDGMYITDVNGTPKKIDDGTLASGPNNPDLDPTGKILAFEWNQRIWTMGIDGSNLTEVAAGNAIYRFPAWSPDGKYIAFLANNSGTMASAVHVGVYFVEVATGKNSYLDLNKVFRVTAKDVPRGPLSWTK